MTVELPVGEHCKISRGSAPEAVAQLVPSLLDLPATLLEARYLLLVLSELAPRHPAARYESPPRRRLGCGEVARQAQSGQAGKLLGLVVDGDDLAVLEHAISH